jgi:hypothetical protein
MYIAFQARQPLILVFFFISLGVYLIIYTERKISHIAAGMFLSLSTVKPQNSLIALLYLLVLWLPSMGDQRRTKSVWLGFAAMSAVSLILTLCLVPGWVGEFLQSLDRYRNYAGTSGAESLWGKGVLSVCMSALFVMVAVAISILSYRLRRHETHLVVFSYMLILQGLICPSHLYTLMMGIPLVILSLSRLIQRVDKTKKYGTYGISLVLVAMFYALYKYWIHIFSEAPFQNDVKELFVAAKNVMPNVPLYATIPLMLVLGIILFMESVSMRDRKFNPENSVYLR